MIDKFSLQVFDSFGQNLIASNHYASPEIKEKIDNIKQGREELLKSWNIKRDLLEQGLDFQNFLRECEDAENWMDKRKDVLDPANVPYGMEVESMIKKHEDIGKAINSHEEKIANLSDQAKKLVQDGNYAEEQINDKLKDVLDQWKELKNALIEQKSLLGESQTLQQFSKDADEIESLIMEKLQTALDESYKDPANIDSKNQKHQAFEAELNANEDRVKNVLEMGKNLIEKQKCGGNEDAVKQRLDAITEEWKFLIEKSNEKTLKLKVTNKRRNFNAAVKDLDFWLNEVESLLKTEENGKDLVSVQNLIKKHKNLEADITARADRINDMNEMANSLVESEQLDAPVLQENCSSVNERYERIKTLAEYRENKLNDANTLYQFYRDLADQESWINEKKLLLRTDDFGKDLTGVNNLRKKHKRFEHDIAAHEPSIRAVEATGNKLMAESNANAKEIEQRLKNLEDNLQELKDLSLARSDKLEESLIYQQFAANLDEEESWINEKVNVLSDDYHGESLAASQSLLKKQDLFEKDLLTHKERYNDMVVTGQGLVNEGNYNTPKIVAKLEQLQKKLTDLEKLGNERRQSLTDNHEFLTFLWKTDVVGNWIAEKEKQLRNDDGVRDLSAVSSLISVS